ncbi:MAG: hypothetical protein ACI4SY_02120 [Sutterella sp.]
MGWVGGDEDFPGGYWGTPIDQKNLVERFRDYYACGEVLHRLYGADLRSLQPEPDGWRAWARQYAKTVKDRMAARGAGRSRPTASPAPVDDEIPPPPVDVEF